MSDNELFLGHPEIQSAFSEIVKNNQLGLNPNLLNLSGVGKILVNDGLKHLLDNKQSIYKCISAFQLLTQQNSSNSNFSDSTELNDEYIEAPCEVYRAVDEVIPILEEAELLESNCEPIQEYKKSGKLSKEFIQWLIGTILAILAMIQAHCYHEEDKASDEPTTQIVINVDVDSADYITQYMNDNINPITSAED